MPPSGADPLKGSGPTTAERLDPNPEANPDPADPPGIWYETWGAPTTELTVGSSFTSENGAEAAPGPPFRGLVEPNLGEPSGEDGWAGLGGGVGMSAVGRSLVAVIDEGGDGTTGDKGGGTGGVIEIAATALAGGEMSAEKDGP
jgi:hypothetical protein